MSRAQTMRTIKKYKNRKFYDTLEKRYINLDRIAKLVSQDEELVVVDLETGIDITRSTLYQILPAINDFGNRGPVKYLRRVLRDDLKPVSVHDHQSSHIMDPYQAINDEIQFRMETLIRGGLIGEGQGHEIMALLTGFSEDGVSDQIIEGVVIERVMNILVDTKDRFGEIEIKLNRLDSVLNKNVS